MKNQDFIKKWYRGGVTPAYQLSDLSEIERKEMDRDLNKIRFESTIRFESENIIDIPENEMKPENTSENKARFFALYWGVKCLRNEFLNDNIPPHKVDVSTCRGLPQQYLELTPLSRITNEDAVALIKLKLAIKKEDSGISDVVIERIDTANNRKNAVGIRAVVTWGNWGESSEGIFISEYSNTPYQLVDELRRRGYYVGDGTEIEYGWVKLKSA